MNCVVISHKVCWPCPGSPSGYCTDGGFPFQMKALSKLFDSTRLLVPVSRRGRPAGLGPLDGHNIEVAPVTEPRAKGRWRQAGMLWWALRNGVTVLREVLRADVVHTPIPGDVGTIGMLTAFLLRKRLFVRHCGNWLVQTTMAERFWKWFMERFAGGRNLMLATGGGPDAPSRRNPNIRWIFATSLTQDELKTMTAPRDFPTPERARLIVACRQERDKGVDMVIRSLPLLAEKFPGITLGVVGDGSALPEFRELAQQLGMGERVTFHGKVDHSSVIRLLNRADLFCYPTSASEGFPKVVVEALACGLPIVTTRVSVLPHLVGRCGVLVEGVRPETIAGAVATCLSNPEGYRAMAANAIQTGRQYSLERWQEAIGTALRERWGPLQAASLPNVA